MESSALPCRIAGIHDYLQSAIETVALIERIFLPTPSLVLNLNLLLCVVVFH